MSLIVGIILTAVSLVTNIIGLAIPYWVHSKTSRIVLSTTVTAEINIGLWSLCSSVSAFGQDTSSCNSISNDSLDDAFKATRALEILGMLAILGALVCVLLKQCAMKSQSLLPRIGSACAFLAGVLMIVGTIVFATRDGVKTSTLHAGFALCIVAGVFAIAAGTAMINAFQGD